MGQAKQRGSFEERKSEAVERNEQERKLREERLDNQRKLDAQVAEVSRQVHGKGKLSRTVLLASVAAAFQTMGYNVITTADPEYDKNL